MAETGVGQPAVVTGTDGRPRCWWAGSDPLYLAYHDTEWGRPVTDDRTLFEKLCLEGFQAGLAWITILRKREHFRRAFAGFDPTAVAAFTDQDVSRLLGDPGIIRHEGKIRAVIGNARALLDLPRPLHEIVWAYAPEPGPPPRGAADVPATTPESVALSRALRGYGFRFLGPTTTYAFMQAMGLVNDHVQGCAARGAAGGAAAAAPSRRSADRVGSEQCLELGVQAGARPDAELLG